MNFTRRQTLVAISALPVVAWLPNLTKPESPPDKIPEDKLYEVMVKIPFPLSAKSQESCINFNGNREFAKYHMRLNSDVGFTVTYSKTRESSLDEILELFPDAFEIKWKIWNDI